MLLAIGPAASASLPYPPNDPYFASQWALKVIKAPQAWTKSTGAGMTVAVVDTGVQFGVPDLPASDSAGSFNCIGTGGTSTPCPGDTSGDGQGHGTWVASVIAADTNNGAGMAGVAPDAKILSVKAIGSDGTGSVQDIAKGIEFAADQGAEVINLSVGPDAFGTPFPQLDCPPGTAGGCLSSPVSSPDTLHQALQPAVDYAFNHGAFVVVSAGNTLPNAGPGPSMYLGMDHLLIVGATGSSDTPASYSDTGSGSTFIWAPGGDGSCASGQTSTCIILASRSGGYQVSEGTSFAAPHVAGVMALLMAMGYSNSAAAARIESTADSTSAGLRLDAAAAVGASSATPATTSQPASPPVLPVAPSPPRTTVTHPAASPAAAKPPVVPAAATTPPPSPVPSPSPSPQPSPSASPTPAGGDAKDPSGLSVARAVADKAAPSGKESPQVVALILVIAAGGAAGVVFIERRLRV
ncbi:MAG TPA: S8 family serine peptidase [Actinomycetota bacterium]|nr:S8 family serine peptidase [Actinomycetota bacterium]